MSGQPRRLRGQPLVVLLALVLGWTGARITSLSGEGGLSLPETVLTVGTAEAAASGPVQAASYLGPQTYPDPRYAQAPVAPAIQYVPVYLAAGGLRGPVGYGPGFGPGYAAYDPYGPARMAGSSVRLASDYPMDRPIAAARPDEGLGLPGFVDTAAPAGAPQHYGEPGALLGTQVGLATNRSHWSMDSWALLRKDGKRALPEGTLPATYGASQTGFVARYRFSLQDPRKVSAYFRTTTSLGATIRESALALGVSARPLAGVPVVAGIEGRMVEQSGGTRIQPAALAVTELPPLTLPGAARAEVYAQAGYVGGRFATPFADGQVRVDRGLIRSGRIEARAGGGVWGGIQKGASRLDAGPGVTLSAPLTRKLYGRVAADWRFRVAGNAEPGSGPTLTVATGF